MDLRKILISSSLLLAGVAYAATQAVASSSPPGPAFGPGPSATSTAATPKTQSKRDPKTSTEAPPSVGTSSPTGA